MFTNLEINIKVKLILENKPAKPAFPRFLGPEKPAKLTFGDLQLLKKIGWQA